MIRNSIVGDGVPDVPKMACKTIKIFISMICIPIYAISPHPNPLPRGEGFFLPMMCTYIYAISPLPQGEGKLEDRWTTCGKIGGGNAQKAGSYKLTWIIPEKLSMKLKKSVEIFVDKL